MTSLAAVLERARDLGFLGPGPVETHIGHALGYLPALEGLAGRALDLGSGGGVPGLVLAGERPDLAWALLDATARRTRFVADAAAELGLVVEVHTARAEEAGHDPAFRGQFAAVVARGFGSPPVTAECGAPFLAVGGRLVVSEPPDRRERWATSALATLGLGPPTYVPGRPALSVLEQQTPCPTRYPRRVGIPGKRPLW